MSEIYVEGTASRRVPYDMMTITLEFNNSRKMRHEAMRDSLNQCEIFLAAMYDQGILPEAFQLVDDESEKQYCHDDDLEAVRKIQFRNKYDLGLINLFLQVIMDLCLDVEYDIEYDYSNRKKLHEELFQEAFEDSERKARIIAEKMGIKEIRLGKVKLNPRMSEDWEQNERISGFYCYQASPEKMSNRMKVSDTLESETISAVWIIGE